MRHDLVSWILSCQSELKSHFFDSHEAVFLLDAFLGQLDGVASGLMNENGSRNSRLKSFARKFGIGCSSSISARTPAHSTSQLDLLFWPWMKTHVRQMKAILEPLNSLGEIRAGVFSHNSAQNDMLEGLKDEWCIRFGSEEYDLKRSMNRFGYRDIKRMLLIQSKSLPSFNYSRGTLSFKDVLEAALMLEEQFFYTIELYEDLKSKTGFRGVFVGNDLTLHGRTVALLAKRDEVQSFSIMHGALKSPLWKQITVNTFFVFGKKDMKVLADVNQSEIILAGSPLVDEKRAHRSDIQEKNSVLVAFSGSGHSISLDHHLNIIRALTEAASGLDFDFRLRLHPKDSASYYEEFLRLPNVYLVDPNQEDIFDSLNRAKVLITAASMTALDAMLYEVPVLTIDLNEEVTYVDFIKQGATTHVDDKDQLNASIAMLYEAKNELGEKILEKQKSFFKASFETKKEGSAAFIGNYIAERLKNAG